MKLDYFSAEWADKPDWVATANSEVYTLWKDKYKNSGHPISQSDVMVSDLNDNVQWRKNKRARLSSDLADAFEEFQEWKGEVQGIKGRLNYRVKTRELGDIHPADLINMGLAIHSIPGMSAEPECVFSRQDIIFSFLKLMSH